MSRLIFETQFVENGISTTLALYLVNPSAMGPEGTNFLMRRISVDLVSGAGRKIEECMMTPAQEAEFQGQLGAQRTSMDIRAEIAGAQALFASEAMRKVQAMYAGSRGQTARRQQAYPEAPSKQPLKRPARHELQDMYQEYTEAYASWTERNRPYSHMGSAFSQPPISHSHPFASTFVPIPIDIRLYEYLTGRRAYGIFWAKETSETFTGSKGQSFDPSQGEEDTYYTPAMIQREKDHNDESNAEWEKESDKKRAEEWERAEWVWSAMEADANRFEWDNVFYPKN